MWQLRSQVRAINLRLRGAGLGTAVSAAFNVLAAASSGTPVSVSPVSVMPSNASVTLSQSQAFAAVDSTGSPVPVNWSINPAGAGSISAAGLYTAPAVLPSSAIVTVTATSTSGPTRTGSSAVTLVSPASRVTGSTYYLAPASSGGSDQNSGLTARSPWLTPNHPLSCGDTILAAPGSYVRCS